MNPEASSVEYVFSVVDIVSIIAIIVGPIVAVFITRWLDDRRDKRKRRFEIFSALMKTRKMLLSYEHVAALNLVEVEFYKDKAVISAWREYLKGLDPVSSNSDANPNHVATKRNTNLAKLIHEIAKTINISIPQLDIFEGGYTPQGWDDDEQQQKFLRMQLINLLQGRGALPISVLPSVQNSQMFPPRPTQDDEY